jgi:hypothetical protein
MLFLFHFKTWLWLLPNYLLQYVHLFFTLRFRKESIKHRLPPAGGVRAPSACSVGWCLVAGAGLFWEKSTAGWLLVADLLWEKSTADWWLISQANRALASMCMCCSIILSVHTGSSQRFLLKTARAFIFLYKYMQILTCAPLFPFLQHHRSGPLSKQRWSWVAYKQAC